MSPGETRLFLDDIFGFKTFTEYNDEIVSERKGHITTNNQLNAVLSETRNQIRHLNDKKEEQKRELSNSVDITGLDIKRKELVDKGIDEKRKLDELTKAYSKEHSEYIRLMTEAATLGKQEKEYINTFKTGKCPTCGHDIDMEILEHRKEKMLEYAATYKRYDAQLKELESKLKGASYQKLSESSKNEIVSIVKLLKEQENSFYVQEKINKKIKAIDVVNLRQDTKDDEHDKKLLQSEINDKKHENKIEKLMVITILVGIISLIALGISIIAIIA